MRNSLSSHIYCEARRTLQLLQCSTYEVHTMNLLSGRVFKDHRKKNTCPSIKGFSSRAPPSVARGHVWGRGEEYGAGARRRTRGKLRGALPRVRRATTSFSRATLSRTSATASREHLPAALRGYRVAAASALPFSSANLGRGSADCARAEQELRAMPIALSGGNARRTRRHARNFDAERTVHLPLGLQRSRRPRSATRALSAAPTPRGHAAEHGVRRETLAYCAGATSTTSEDTRGTHLEPTP